MKVWKLGIVGCLAAALCSGCVSTGNKGWDDLSEEEKQEVENALAEAKVEVEIAWQDAQHEIRAELEETNWAEILLEEDTDGRPRKLLWYRAGAETPENEIVDWVGFGESLSLEDWEPCEETTADFQEEIVYTVQEKKYVGMLDRKKDEYRTLGSIIVYEDADLVYVTTDTLEGTAGKIMETVLGEKENGWFGSVYKVPEGDLKILRQQ